MGPAQICQQSQQHREQSLVQEDGMGAKRVAVSLLMLALLTVAVEPAAALVGEPSGVYGVGGTAGGTSINSNVVVLAHPVGTAVIELRGDGTWAGGLASTSTAAGGVRLTGTLFDAQADVVGAFDLTVSINDSITGTLSRTSGGTTQTFPVNGQKGFSSDSGFDGVYPVERRSLGGSLATTEPEYVVVLSDKTRLPDVATPVAIVYLAADGRYYAGVDPGATIHQAGAATAAALQDASGQPIGAYSIALTLEPLMLAGEMSIAQGVPSFDPGGYALTGNRAL